VQGCRRLHPMPTSSSRPYIGGQAVLEGVMMRAPRSFAVVVRRRDGSLQIRERAMREGSKGAAGWPLVRGVMSLVESLRLGSEALRFSTEQLEKDIEVEEARRRRGVGLDTLVALGLALFAAMQNEGDPYRERANPDTGSAGAKRSGKGSWLMLALAIGFFVALPQGAAAGFNRAFGLGLELQSPVFQAMTGALKLTIVVGYLLAIRRVPEIRRVFQYHGAEHKTISTYEAGEPLTVEHARAKTTMHPRCGTTFLVMVALVSILVFTAVGAVLPRIHTGSVWADNVLFFFEKLPFLPVLVAIAFELQRVLARYCATGPLRALLWPGFLVQKITTAEPDEEQLEVALASLRVTLFRQEHGGAGELENDVAFPSYGALVGAQTLRPTVASAA
jgi:uncharacterized protein YqhQ